MAFRYQRSVGVVVLVTSVLLIVGAVYGGFHYAIDVLAGASLGFVVATGIAILHRSA
jgi:membrane-associated phospholipid phosphatase